MNTKAADSTHLAAVKIIERLPDIEYSPSPGRPSGDHHDVIIAGSKELATALQSYPELPAFMQSRASGALQRFLRIDSASRDWNYASYNFFVLLDNYDLMSPPIKAAITRKAKELVDKQRADSYLVANLERLMSRYEELPTSIQPSTLSAASEQLLNFDPKYDFFNLSVRGFHIACLARYDLFDDLAKQELEGVVRRWMQQPQFFEISDESKNYSVVVSLMSNPDLALKFAHKIRTFLEGFIKEADLTKPVQLWFAHCSYFALVRHHKKMDRAIKKARSDWPSARDTRDLDRLMLLWKSFPDEHVLEALAEVLLTEDPTKRQISALPDNDIRTRLADIEAMKTALREINSVSIAAEVERLLKQTKEEVFVETLGVFEALARAEINGVTAFGPKPPRPIALKAIAKQWVGSNDREFAHHVIEVVRDASEARLAAARTY